MLLTYEWNLGTAIILMKKILKTRFKTGKIARKKEASEE